MEVHATLAQGRPSPLCLPCRSPLLFWRQLDHNHSLCSPVCHSYKNGAKENAERLFGGFRFAGGDGMGRGGEGGGIDGPHSTPLTTQQQLRPSSKATGPQDIHVW